MHCRDTSKREKELASWDRKVPSFSSTLLDEIYRSIDEGAARKEDGERVRRKQRDEEDAVAQRTRLLERWMEKKEKVSVTARTRKNASPEKSQHYVVDNDPLFFSSGSNSSDSNSSLFSEHDSLPLPAVKTRSSCFLPPKPIRTCVKPGEKKTVERDDVVPESAKSRALKMYAHLKKMKQPISPGVKLTSFINSILSKKPSNRATTTATAKPTCSSASSFSRSRLNHQTAPSSARTGYSVKIVSVNAEPVMTRTLNRDEPEPLRRHLIEPKRTARKSCSRVESKPVKTNAARVSKDEDYAESDCSEDLFEIDHMKPSSINGELPVYETTRVVLKDSKF